MDFQNLGMREFLVLGGLGLALLAVFTYFLKAMKGNSPKATASLLAGLVLGLASGVVAMFFVGFRLEPQPVDIIAQPGGGRVVLDDAPGGGKGKGGPKGGKGGGMPGGGMMGGGMPGGGGPGMGGGMPGGGMGGGMGRGPSSKTQLAGLITKIDQLAAKPLKIEFTAERKKQIGEQLAGLADMKELSEDEAKKRLDALLKTVEADKATLEAAGYRWPGAQAGGRGGFQAPPDVPNPFQEGDNQTHLKSLEKQIAVKPS